MPTPFIMPKMDMDQEVVTIIEWLKKEGEKITKGEPVVTVETDKITSDIEAPETGTLVGILYHENEEAPVTKVVAYILAEGESLSELPGSQENSQELLKPELAASAHASATTNLRATPVAEKMAASMNIDLAGVQTKGDRITKSDIEKFLAAPQTLPGGKVTATPAARRMSKENEIDLEGISGSGPRGRIQSIDVVNASTSFAQVSTPHTAPTPVKAANLVAGSSIPLVGKRKRIAERLTASYQNSPHIYLTVEVDMSRAEESRQRMNKLNEKTGKSSISVTAYLAKLVAWNLKRHPYLNASIVKDRIEFWEDVNLGIATAVSDGLVVPVIHQADQLGLAEINEQMRYLAKQARDGVLTREEVDGGTFTISNLGMFGIKSFTAIINPPQTGILAVGTTIRTPVVVDENDTIEVRPMMSMTLSVDHRIVDGAVAAQFLADLVRVIENPDMIIY
jgi:pyruvate dehydrogenase E2 component (dihydrolipoamide acetyltransferase)